MNQINNNDNNNLNDGECMQNKTYVKSTRELGKKEENILFLAIEYLNFLFNFRISFETFTLLCIWFKFKNHPYCQNYIRGKQQQKGQNKYLTGKVFQFFFVCFFFTSFRTR